MIYAMGKWGTYNMKMTKQEKSWILYDWANSVYATIMMAAVVPIYFTTIAGAAGQEGDYWWSIATMIAMLITAIAAPLIGAFADYWGYKKKLFVIFLVMGLGFTAYSAITLSWVGLMIGYAVSHMAFNAGNLVYDSFLPDVTTRDRMDKISSYGYAFGYIGGSTIPFIVSIALIQFGDKIGLTGTLPIQISIGIAVVWWLLFSIPFLKNIKQEHGIDKPKIGVFKATFGNVGKTAIKIIKDKKIFYFVLAYFFYIDGVGTVITMSTAYGTTLGLDATGMILALLVTQLVAFPCSIIFGNIAKKIGSLKMLMVAIIVYLAVCILGFIMGFGLEENWFGVETALTLFWILAVMVGTVQGGIQALSRSYFGKIIPPDNAGEFFGFFDIFGKFAAIIGPGLYAVTKATTGRSSFAILSLVLLFLIALIIMGIGKKHFGSEPE